MILARFAGWWRYRRAYTKLVRGCYRAGYGLSWARDARFREQARQQAMAGRPAARVQGSRALRDAKEADR
jgi:hypothetical protein